MCVFVYERERDSNLSWSLRHCCFINNEVTLLRPTYFHRNVCLTVNSKLDLSPAIFFSPAGQKNIYTDSKIQIIGVCRGEEKKLYMGFSSNIQFSSFILLEKHCTWGIDYQVLAHLSVVCPIVSHLDVDLYINSLVGKVQTPKSHPTPNRS